MRLQIQAAETSFLSRLAGLNRQARSFDIWRQLRTEAVPFCPPGAARQHCRRGGHLEHPAQPTATETVSLLFSVLLIISLPCFLSWKLKWQLPLIHCCRPIWNQARCQLMKAAARNKKAADQQWIPAPPYQPGQWVLLSALDLPLRVELCELAFKVHWTTS